MKKLDNEFKIINIYRIDSIKIFLLEKNWSKLQKANFISKLFISYGNKLFHYKLAKNVKRMLMKGFFLVMKMIIWC